jgi:hypothetical protein
MNSEPSSVVNTSPSLSGQSALAATPGIGESHVGAGVEVDEVAEELVSVEEEDASEDVEVIISSEEVEVENSEDVEVTISSDEVELVDTSEEVEVTSSSDDVDVERSLEVVVVASSSSRSFTSTDEVIDSEVDVVTISVVLD